MSKRVLNIGDKYDRLTIIEDLGSRPCKNGTDRRKYYLCRCDCGRTKEVIGSEIGKHVKSCGCLQKDNREKPISPGTVFGRLTVLEKREVRNAKDVGRGYRYLCKCECGKTKELLGCDLRGGTKSCGCASKGHMRVSLGPGDVVGRLTILEPYKTEYVNGRARLEHLCKCECGNTVVVPRKTLLSGEARSCGCLMIETSRRTAKYAYEESIRKNVVDGTNIASISLLTLYKNNTSGIRGVCWDKEVKKWRAIIIMKKKKYDLGRYKDINEAAKARKEAESVIFGEFLDWYHSRTNDDMH